MKPWGISAPKAEPAATRLRVLLQKTDARANAVTALGKIGPAASAALPDLQALLKRSLRREEDAIREAIAKIESTGDEKPPE